MIRSLFLFNAATIPKIIPNGTAITTLIILILILTGRRLAIISIAEKLGLIAVDVPQSHLVKIFPNQLKY